MRELMLKSAFDAIKQDDESTFGTLLKSINKESQKYLLEHEPSLVFQSVGEAYDFPSKLLNFACQNFAGKCILLIQSVYVWWEWGGESPISMLCMENMHDKSLLLKTKKCLKFLFDNGADIGAAAQPLRMCYSEKEEDVGDFAAMLLDLGAKIEERDTPPQWLDAMIQRRRACKQSTVVLLSVLRNMSTMRDLRHKISKMLWEKRYDPIWPVETSACAKSVPDGDNRWLEKRYDLIYLIWPVETRTSACANPWWWSGGDVGRGERGDVGGGGGGGDMISDEGMREIDDLFSSSEE